MTILLLSSSLNPESNSRALLREAERSLMASGKATRFIDLRDFPLPLCDGDKAYSHPSLKELGMAIREAEGVLIGVPIYNFDVNAAIKNLVELTGKSWENHVVGFLCAAGGRCSYMSVMSFANSLMLDFRCLIVPRFVYAVGDDFEMPTDGEAILTNPKVIERVHGLSADIVKLAGCWSKS